MAVTSVSLPPQEVKQQDFFVGTVRVNGRMDWTMLDSAVTQAFKVSRTFPLHLIHLAGTFILNYVDIEHVERTAGYQGSSECSSTGFQWSAFVWKCPVITLEGMPRLNIG